MKKLLLLSFLFFLGYLGYAANSITLLTNTICNGGSTTFTVHNTSHTYGTTTYAVGTTVGGTDIISTRIMWASNAGGGDYDTIVTVSPSTTTTYYLTVSAGSNSSDMLTVNTAATANAGASATTCQGVPYTLVGSNIGGSASDGTWSIFAWSGTMTNTATQLSNTSATITPNTVVFTPIAGNTGTVTLKLTTDNPSGVCGAVSDTMILIVNALPTAYAGSAATICSAYTLSTATIGGSASTGTWSITATTGSMTNTATQLSNTAATLTPNTVVFTPIGGNSGTVTLTLTTDDPAGPCGAVTSTVILTINATATASAGSATSICSGTVYTLSGASLGLGASTGAWSISAVSGTMTNAASQLSSIAATANPSLVTFTPIITDSGTVTLTLTTAGPCTSVAPTVVITVRRAPTANAGSATSICSGIAYPLTGSSIGGSALNGTWSITAWSGSMTNTPSQLSSTSATATPSSVTFTPLAGSGTVTLTLTTDDPSGPCLPVSSSVILSINPAAIANAGSAAPICSGLPYTLAGASVTGGASLGTWTITSVTGTMTNAASQLSNTSATGSPALVTFTPISTNSGTVTLTLTTDDPIGPCLAVSSTRVLTVSLAPTVSAGSATTICSGTPYTLTGATIGGGATNGIWSITSATGTMTTNSSQLSNTSTTITPSTVTFTPIASNGGTVTLTLTTDDPLGPCLAVSSSVTLTVNKAATSNAGSNNTICAGLPYTLSGSSVGGGASNGTWSITAVTGSMNSSASQLSNTGATITPSSVTFTPIATNFGTITLTLSTDDPSGPCPLVSSTLLLTVEEPALANAGSNVTICKGTPYTLIGSSISGSATTGRWSISGATGTMTNSSSQLSSTSFTSNPSGVVFTPNSSNTGSVILTLTTNTPAGSCGAVTSSIVVTISNAPTSNAGTNTTICSGSPYALVGSSIGGAASNGTWSITSATGTMTTSTSQLSNLGATATPSSVLFTPIATNSGTVTLTLTTDDPFGPCQAVSNFVVLTVDLAATVNAGSTATICSGSSYALIGSSIGGGAATGTWTITATTGTMTNASSQLSNTTGTANPSSVLFTPIASNSGTITLTLSTNDPAGPCGIMTSSVLLTINPAATVNAGSAATLCAGTPYILTGSGFGGGATQGTWTISSVTGTMTNAATQLSNNNPTASPSLVTFTAIPTNSGTVTLTLTTDDPIGPCSAVAGFVVLTINPLPLKPVFSTTNPSSICYNQQGVNFGVTSVPNVNYLWSSTNTNLRFYGKRTSNCLIDFPANGTFSIYVTAINPITGCRDSSLLSLSTAGTIPALPKIIATNSNKTLVCLDNKQPTFQWGYDDNTYLGVDVLGATLQDFTPVGGIITTNNYYVKLSSGGCTYKVYYIAPLSIQPTKFQSKISLQPNPNAGFFNLKLDGDALPEEAYITDILGKKLMQLTLHSGNQTIQVQSLPNGIYYLHLLNSSGDSPSLKFIINK